MKTVALLLIALPIVLLLAGQLGWLSGRSPDDLGVRDGRLKPPSATPNSVSSQAVLYPDHPQKAYAAVQPLTFKGDGVVALDALARHLSEQPGTLVVKRERGYVYAQCTTRWLRFTDDLELWLDESANLIHVRSASRLGRKDFGVNRARVEALRNVLAGV